MSSLPGISVELVESMGSDLTVVNAARVSLDKRTAILRDCDKTLIHFLAKNGHMSPFRHVMFQFRIKAPEFIARQAFKHNVGINTTSGELQHCSDAWNEVSMRYVRMKELYTPTHWRKAPAEARQGSSLTEELDEKTQEQCSALYEKTMTTAMTTYEELLKLGVAREMARMVLPLSVETNWVWTMSLQAVCHFVKLRQHPGAQKEIQEMANQMEKIVQPLAPVSWQALTTGDLWHLCEKETDTKDV